jgi:hypothetical protein
MINGTIRIRLSLGLIVVAIVHAILLGVDRGVVVALVRFRYLPRR